jgi:hypothetical protein
MKEGAKVSEHLNSFNDILSQLESIGVKMDDEDKAVMITCTLPDSYDNLVITSSCSKVDKLSLKTIILGTI